MGGSEKRATRQDDQKTSQMTEEAIERVCSRLLDMFMKRMDEKFQSLELSIKAVTGKVEKQEERNNILEKRIDGLEQYSRNCNIRVYGVEESEGENTVELLVSLFKEKMGLTVAVDEMEKCHRIGQRSRDKGRERAVLVRFVSHRKKSEVFGAKKWLKSSGIVVREDLTKARFEVFLAAVKKYGNSKVWTVDGKIAIRETGSERRYITHISEL